MKMTHTKYGYITPEEAKIDSDLDKWLKETRKKNKKTATKSKPKARCGDM